MNPRLRNSWIDKLPPLSDDPTHPAQIALRTYALALSLSLSPALIPILASLASPSKSKALVSLKRVLRREFGLDGFAFAVTLAVAGGAAIRQLWDTLDKNTTGDTPDNTDTLLSPDFAHRKTGRAWLTSAHKTFISNVFSSSIGILLLQAGRLRAYRMRRDLIPPTIALPLTPPTPNNFSQINGTSPTLELTLLLFVRALDAVLQKVLHKVVETETPGNKVDYRRESSPNPRVTGNEALEEKPKKDSSKVILSLTSRVDALVFWACSARIMWCFFYEPRRLPRSYVKWIATLANLDNRVIETLRLVREGRWSYTRGSPSHPHILSTFSKELGYSPSWGDPALLPAYGGAGADIVWKALGVNNRRGVGGLPCELVHGSVGSGLGLSGSCTANSSIRGVKAFLEAIAIYLPVHFLPILLTRPRALLIPHRALGTLLATLRSATFLSTFVTLYWYTVCLTRSLVLAKLLPFVSHDFWDGPLGCVLAGCLVCGSSIWVENGRRRGEMALYVLPRAVRACLPDTWVQSGNRKGRITEQITFILSFSTLITAAVHYPESLRGLSRWTLAFITNGPNAGFWKRKRQSPSEPTTPRNPATLIDGRL